MAAAPVSILDISKLGNAVDSEVITVSTAAIGLTSTKYLANGVKRRALLQVITNAIYFNVEGAATTPASTTSYLTATGDYILTAQPDFVRMLRVASDSLVKVTYFES